MRSYKHFFASEHEAVVKVTLVNTKFFDVDQYEELRDELMSFANLCSTDKVLIDLSEVEYCSTAVMRALISIRDRLSGRGGKLKLCGVNSNVREAFRQLKLDQSTFEIHPTQVAASFGNGEGQ